MISSSSGGFLSSLTSSAADGVEVGMARMAASSKKFGAMDEAKAAATGKDFESMFLAQMLEQMFGESSGDESFGGQETNEIYRGFMMNEYAKQITNAGGIGIADYVTQELMKTQEV
ncbi:MAG: hypothetical protein EBR02_03665 [Alphaproteobacteria bacterium]|nr:hypothetical protein [Alphaproteobacteria bacterium]